MRNYQKKFFINMANKVKSQLPEALSIHKFEYSENVMFNNRCQWNSFHLVWNSTNPDDHIMRIFCYSPSEPEYSFVHFVAVIDGKIIDNSLGMSGHQYYDYHPFPDTISKDEVMMRINMDSQLKELKNRIPDIAGCSKFKRKLFGVAYYDGINK